MSVKLDACVLSENQLQAKLQVAQQKLLDAHTPALLRFSYYLRICCALMRMLERQGHPEAATTHRPRTRYSTLMAALSARNAQWWQTCYVNELGMLESDDSVIMQLLEPVEVFHYLVRSAIAPSVPSHNAAFRLYPYKGHRFVKVAVSLA